MKNTLAYMNYLLSESMLNTLNGSFEDITIDFAEVAIDSLITTGALEKIPLISTCVSIYKIQKTVTEYNHMKKLAIFVNEIGYGCAEEKRKEYIAKFKEFDEKQRNKELEYIVLILAQYIGYDKPKWLAKIYLAYLDKRITGERFASYAELINRFLPGDFDMMLKGDQLGLKDTEVADTVLRLMSCGVFTPVSKSVQAENYPGMLSIPAEDVKDYVLTEYGKGLREILK